MFTSGTTDTVFPFGLYSYSGGNAAYLMYFVVNDYVLDSTDIGAWEDPYYMANSCNTISSDACSSTVVVLLYQCYDGQTTNVASIFTYAGGSATAERYIFTSGSGGVYN